MIWGPFVLALVLGLIVSAGLYFAYLWPQVEPEDPDPASDEATPSATSAPAPDVATPTPTPAEDSAGT